MDSFYRETLWFRLLMPTCNLVLALVIVFLFASLTGTNYFRMLLEAVAVDAVCGIIVHIDRKLFSDPIMIFIALLAVLLECVAYYYILKRKHKMLLRNKRQMERYYRHAAKHMQDMEAGWNFLGGGSAERNFWADDERICTKNGSAVPNTAEQMEKYLRKTQQRFFPVCLIIF